MNNININNNENTFTEKELEEIAKNLNASPHSHQIIAPRADNKVSKKIDG